ncbi:MAG: glutaredoxin family protein [Bacteroidota bacterium]
MRVLLLILIAVSGWVGLTQFRVQQNLDLEAMAEAAEAEVVVYQTSWCPVCKEAREHLEARGVPFVARDIETDPAAFDAYRELGGNGAVPLLVIRGETVTGFNAEAVDVRLYAEDS